MRRFAFGLVCLGIAALLGAGCGGGSGKGAALTIGAFNPFSGGDADFGPEMVGQTWTLSLDDGGPANQGG